MLIYKAFLDCKSFILKIDESKARTKTKCRREKYGEITLF